MCKVASLLENTAVPIIVDDEKNSSKSVRKRIKAAGKNFLRIHGKTLLAVSSLPAGS